jgi:transposase
MQVLSELFADLQTVSVLCEESDVGRYVSQVRLYFMLRIVWLLTQFICFLQIVYKEAAHIIVQRDEYIRDMLALQKENKRRIVYMDESFIHHHYKCHDDSLHDPTDERPVPKSPHKGKRYCFIAAIIDADPTVPAAQRTAEQKAHLMQDTLRIFQGGKKGERKKKDTKDYHGMFDTDYFVAWMKALLKALQDRNVQNAVIVMDNAKYHKTNPPDTPKRSWRKEQLLEACACCGIEVPPNSTCPVIWSRLRLYITEHILPIIVTMARAEGHEVWYSPPHYSDLQPIEFVWAIVKNAVGRMYNKDTTFRDVKDRLQNEFDILQSDTVHGCINKANAKLTALHEVIRRKEQASEGEDADESDDGENIEVQSETDDDTYVSDDSLFD